MNNKFSITDTKLKCWYRYVFLDFSDTIHFKTTIHIWIVLLTDNFSLLMWLGYSSLHTECKVVHVPIHNLWTIASTQGIAFIWLGQPRWSLVVNSNCIVVKVIGIHRISAHTFIRISKFQNQYCIVWCWNLQPPIMQQLTSNNAAVNLFTALENFFTWYGCWCNRFNCA